MPTSCTGSTIRAESPHVADLIFTIVALNVFPNFLLFHIAYCLKSYFSLVNGGLPIAIVGVQSKMMG